MAKVIDDKTRHRPKSELFSVAITPPTANTADATDVHTMLFSFILFLC
jgi:hypothetical protein